MCVCMGVVAGECVLVDECTHAVYKYSANIHFGRAYGGVVLCVCIQSARLLGHVVFQRRRGDDRVCADAGLRVLKHCLQSLQIGFYVHVLHVEHFKQMLTL